MLYETFTRIHLPASNVSGIPTSREASRSYANTGQSRIADVIDSKYPSIDAITKKFTVYSSGVGYRVYDRREDFEKDLSAMDESARVFHEVIFSSKQKLKFDIDAPIDELIKFAKTVPNIEWMDEHLGELDDGGLGPRPPGDGSDASMGLGLSMYRGHVENPRPPGDICNNKPRDGSDENLEEVTFSDDLQSLLDQLAEECREEYREETPPDVPKDASAISATEPSKIFDMVVRIIREAIYTAFLVVYGKTLIQYNEIVCASADPTGKKYSTHIIIDGYFVSCAEQAQEFTYKVLSYIPAAYRVFLDFGVNKSIQNFRVAGCHKKDDTRVKRIMTAHHVSRTFITNVSDCEALPDIAASRVRRTFTSSMLHGDDIDKVLALCEQSRLLDAHQFKSARGGLLLFSRKRPSVCELCNDEHTRDGTLLILVQTNGSTVTVFKQCRRYNERLEEAARNGEPATGGAKTTLVGEFVSDNQYEVTSKQTTAKAGDRLKKALAANPRGEQGMFSQLPDTCVRTSDSAVLETFPLAGTLVVHAAMKMGKTKELIKYIDTFFADTVRTQKIIFLSFRQTFSGNIKDKFPGFTMYSDVRGSLNQLKLILQVESLHRLDIHEGVAPPDLLVLDESESIIEQFDSGLLRSNFNNCFAIFQYLVKYSRHVVCMDAMIGDRTYNMLARMRPSAQLPLAANTNLADTGCSDGSARSKNSSMQPSADLSIGGPQMLYYHNTYQNATDDQYFITSDKLAWLGVLYTAVEGDERIAVPMNSLSEAKILAEALTKKYPQKAIKLYSSETLVSEKKTHFASVDAYWSKYDVLIYTPTVSAGVSFEQKHFAKVFAYFTDQSCPAETCIQMIGRIRDVSTHQLFVCVIASGASLPTTAATISTALCNKRDGLFHSYDNTGVSIEYSRHGEIIYHTSDYFYLWLENTRIRNLSKNSFALRFIQLVRASGAKFAELSETEYEIHTGSPMRVGEILSAELQNISDAHAHCKSEIKSIACEKIASARELDGDDVAAIQDAFVAQQDVSPEDMAAFDKYKLRRVYDYPHALDAKFVAIYNQSRIKRIFRNLARIHSYAGVTPADSSAKDLPTENLSARGNDLGASSVSKTLDASKTLDILPRCDVWRYIQAEERACHEHLMEQRADHQDIGYRYVADQHRYALTALYICGWDGIYDQRHVHQVQLLVGIRANGKSFWDLISSACIEFDLRKPRAEDITSQDNNQLAKLSIRYVNQITKIMYGTRVITRKQDPLTFFITRENLFTFVPSISENSHVPLIRRDTTHNTQSVAAATMVPTRADDPAADGDFLDILGDV